MNRNKFWNGILRAHLHAPDDQPLPTDPTFTLEAQVAEARALMGADRWHELMQDWENHHDQA